MLFPKLLRLFCANCGIENEEDKITIKKKVVWESFYHLLNYEFICFRCGTLNQAEIQSDKYQERKKNPESWKDDKYDY